MISEIKGIAIETIQNKTQRKDNFLKNEQSISELWNHFKQTNICIIGVLKEKVGGTEIFEKIRAEIFLNLTKTINPYI